MLTLRICPESTLETDRRRPGRRGRARRAVRRRNRGRACRRAPAAGCSAAPPHRPASARACRSAPGSGPPGRRSTTPPCGSLPVVRLSHRTSMARAGPRWSVRRLAAANHFRRVQGTVADPAAEPPMTHRCLPSPPTVAPTLSRTVEIRRRDAARGGRRGRKKCFRGKAPRGSKGRGSPRLRTAGTLGTEEAGRGVSVPLRRVRTIRRAACPGMAGNGIERAPNCGTGRVSPLQNLDHAADD